MSRVLKWVLGIAFAGGVAAILVVAYVRGRQEAAQEAAQERPAAGPSRVRAEAGQTFVTLDAATQSKSGIETRTLAAATERQEVRANAVVLSVQGLTELRNSYLSLVAQVEKAKAALDVSQREYDRLKQLYEDNQNAAAKAVQAAEGNLRSDQTSFRAANEALQLNETLGRQTWGPVISKWLVEGSPDFTHLMNQQDSLLQVSMPPAAAGAPPKTATVQMPSGKVQGAEFLSAYPAVDARIQNPTFLYVTRATPELIPGVTLTVLLPTGPAARGVMVPGSAVVWWQGKAWTYVKVAPDRFARRELPADAPVSAGWFVTSGFSPGDPIVVRGGQQLLSEEFRSQIQSLYEGEPAGGDADRK